jgi:hypothetical protein
MTEYEEWARRKWTQLDAIMNAVAKSFAEMDRDSPEVLDGYIYCDITRELVSAISRLFPRCVSDPQATEFYTRFCDDYLARQNHAQNPTAVEHNG